MVNRLETGIPPRAPSAGRRRRRGSSRPAGFARSGNTARSRRRWLFPPAPADRSETRNRTPASAPAGSAASAPGIESPPHSARHASEMMNAMPSVTSTCPSGLLFSRVSTSRSNSPPSAATMMPGAERGDPEIEAVEGAQRDRGKISAEHEERAMREVRQPHQPENQRKSRRQQEQQPAERQAVETLDDPKLHRLPILSGKSCAIVAPQWEQNYCSRFLPADSRASRPGSSGTRPCRRSRTG